MNLKPLSEIVSIELSVREAYMLLSLLEQTQKDGVMYAWSNVNKILKEAVTIEDNNQTSN